MQQLPNYKALNKTNCEWGMVAHTFNPNTCEMEAGISLSSRIPQSTEQVPDIQDYTEKPCFERPNRN